MNPEESQVTFALIHSPLTGPQVWWPVAERLRAMGHGVVVPDLADSVADTRSLGEQHIESAATAIIRELTHFGRPPSSIVLAAHSGAGPLLGALGARLPCPPAAYLFVDAGLPPDAPATRLDLIRAEGGAWVAEFEQYLEAGGLFPNWTEADLQDQLPDPAARTLVLSILRPRGRAYFTEMLESARNRARLPGGYLLFTDAYDEHVRQAAKWGWAIARLPGGHFQMLADPESVAAELIVLAASGARAANDTVNDRDGH